MDYFYASEKLHDARRALMLPHTEGEAHSIMMALHEVSAGLMNSSPDDFDDTARGYYETLKEAMDTTGIEDPAHRGTWVIKGEQMTVDEKLALASAVDDLAYWLDEKTRED